MKLLRCVAVLGALVWPVTSYADPVIASGHLQLDWNVTDSVGGPSIFMEFPWRPIFPGPELFIVPIGIDPQGVKYEAVFF